MTRHSPGSAALAVRADDALSVRRPTLEDGAALHRMVVDGGGLDANSPYAYLMMAQWFADTCLLAEEAGRPIGFVMGFRPPRQPDTLFVWQVGIDPSQRGRGLGKALLLALVDHAPPEVRFLEATVTPSNAASEALFRGVARSLGAWVEIRDLFPASAFPGSGHEAERLFRIGPFSRSTQEGEITHGHL